MGRKREKKDKAPQRNNYKAEDLLRICYPDNDGGDEVTVNTRRLAGSLPRPVPPKMDNRPIVQPGDQWSDENWLKTELEKMDRKLEQIDLARPLVHALDSLRGEDEGPIRRKEKTVPKIELTAEQKKQLKASARLTHYGRRGHHKESLQQRHTLVHCEPRDGHGEAGAGGRHVQR